MNKVIKLVMEYKTTHSDLIFQNLIKELENLIHYFQNMVPLFYKEDLKQEILICIFHVLEKFEIKEIKKLNIELFNLEILKILKLKEHKNINNIFHNKYLYGFIKKYGNDLLKSLHYFVMKISFSNIYNYQ